MATSVPTTQRSLEDLGRPLEQTTFCIVDVETTGEAPATGSITEVAAVRIRGGRLEGTLSTLVDPGRPIPAWVSALTGIDAALVADAPPFSAIAENLSDFIGDTVVVGHNVRYDLSCLNHELERCGRPRLENPSVCTLALARRLVRDEVRDCKLATLADALRLDHRPSHRALDDVLATADLLSTLLERAGRWGVRGLTDLLELPRITGHPQAAKLRLTDDLPHAPGVYLFRDRSANVLYVGKATDLRARVRSYFSTDDRRKVGALLRSVATIDHEVCVHPLAAAVREVRLIAHHLPRFNAHATRWRSMAYVRLTDETFPRLAVVRNPPPAGTVHLGPLGSAGAAHRVIDAVTTVVPLRRCTARIPTRRNEAATGQLTLDGVAADTRPGRCAPAQLGIAWCPCAGDVSPSAYAAVCEPVRRGFDGDAEVLLDLLGARIAGLADEQRYEKAATVRDRAATLASALHRKRRLEAWRRPSRVVVELPDGAGAEILHGLLGRTWAAGAEPEDVRRPAPVGPEPVGPIPREEIYERLCIVTELERARSPWRIAHVEGLLAVPARRIESFAVREPTPPRSPRSPGR